MQHNALVQPMLTSISKAMADVGIFMVSFGVDGVVPLSAS